jgi:hypothetical protein
MTDAKRKRPMTLEEELARLHAVREHVAWQLNEIDRVIDGVEAARRRERNGENRG